MRKQREQLAREKEREYWDPLRKVCETCCVRTGGRVGIGICGDIVPRVRGRGKPKTISLCLLYLVSRPTDGLSHASKYFQAGQNHHTSFGLRYCSLERRLHQHSN